MSTAGVDVRLLFAVLWVGMADGPEGYDDFKQILAPPLAIAHDANKNFFLSEFGGPSCGGKLASDCHAGPSGAPAGCKDSCAWFDTPTEKKLGLVLAQKVRTL